MSACRRLSVSHRRDCFGDAPLVAFDRKARGLCRRGGTVFLISSIQPFAPTLADGVVSANEYQQETPMKRMCLAALTGAIAISTVALAIDVASAATPGAVPPDGL